MISKIVILASALTLGACTMVPAKELAQRDCNAFLEHKNPKWREELKEKWIEECVDRNAWDIEFHRHWNRVVLNQPFGTFRDYRW